MDELSDIVWASQPQQSQQKPSRSPIPIAQPTPAPAAVPYRPVSNMPSRPATPAGTTHSRSASPANKQALAAAADDAFGSLLSGVPGAAAIRSSQQQQLQSLSLDEQRRRQQLQSASTFAQQQPNQTQQTAYRPISAQSSQRPITQSAALASVPLTTAPAPATNAFADLASFASAPKSGQHSPAPVQLLKQQQPQSSSPKPLSASFTLGPQQAFVPLVPTSSGTNTSSPAKNTSNAFSDLLSAPNAPKLPTSASASSAPTAKTVAGAVTGLSPQRGATANSTSPNMPMASIPTSSAWGNLDFLASASPAASLGANAAPSSTSADPAHSADIFDVSFLGAQSAKQQTQKQPNSDSIDDNPLGILSRPATASITSSSTASPQDKSPTHPADRSASGSTKENLGKVSDLSHQTLSKREGSGQSSTASSQRQQHQRQQGSRDFAISQIVSMGFDVDSANSALDAADENVEAAIEMLIQNSRAEKQMNQTKSPTSGSIASGPGFSSHTDDDEYEIPRSDEWRDGTNRYPGHSSQYGGDDGFQSNPYGSHRRPSREGISASNIVDTQKIMNTASAIGMSVFKNAKTIFDYSKKKITEVIDKAREDGPVGTNRTQSNRQFRYDPSASGYRDSPGDGYEQWGSSNEGVDGYRDNDHRRSPAGFSEGYSDLGTSPPMRSNFSRNDDDDDHERQAPIRRNTGGSHDGTRSFPLGQTSTSHSRQTTSNITSAVQSASLIDTSSTDLLGTNTPAVAPPAQRTAPAKSPAQIPSAASSPPKPAPAPKRPIVNATPEQVSLSNAAKDRGNELFKKGQFGDADTSYTRAIDALPAGHALLAVLYNNRAAARLKTGHYKEAVSDCEMVQELEPGDLKSLLRRATAYEALEKWDLARDDYRTIMAADPNVKGASAGLARCNKALQTENGGSAAAQSSIDTGNDLVGLSPVMGSKNRAPKAQATDLGLFAATTAASAAPPKPVSAYVQGAIDQAVNKLRDQAQQAEQEENMKLALKDQIDDRINQWRRSKEDNLRALLSSLDAVLWPELGWKTIALSELITPQQVKVRYLRAVAKVHPDKLSMDASVEHKLVANGVFATLNRAWDAFKTQNGIA